jgi:hypothetical protein
VEQIPSIIQIREAAAGLSAERFTYRVSLPLSLQIAVVVDIQGR